MLLNKFHATFNEKKTIFISVFFVCTEFQKSYRNEFLILFFRFIWCELENLIIIFRSHYLKEFLVVIWSGDRGSVWTRYLWSFCSMKGWEGFFNSSFAWWAWVFCSFEWRVESNRTVWKAKFHRKFINLWGKVNLWRIPTIELFKLAIFSTFTHIFHNFSK